MRNKLVSALYVLLSFTGTIVLFPLLVLLFLLNRTERLLLHFSYKRKCLNKLDQSRGRFHTPLSSGEFPNPVL